MFDGKYFDWNQKRIKAIVDFYGYKFFYFKRILDLGCGYGDLGGVLYRLGSDLTGVDARQEHLKVVSKKYNGIKTVQANLDGNWPFHGQKFDMILDLGLLCHLENYEKHLAAVCASTTHLVLETAVCDSDDPQKCMLIEEDHNIYDLSYGGRACRPSAAAIERVLLESGMNFKRIDNSKFNSGDYVYDWYLRNDNSCNLNKRRIWFAVKDNSPIQFANPASELAYPPITVATSPQGYITPIINSGIPVTPTTASPKPPISVRMEAEAKARTAATAPQPSSTMPEPSPIRTTVKSLSLNDRVRTDSRDFALITPDPFQTTVNPDIKGIILPNTHSSKMWFKKIAPLFPNIKLSNKALSMTGFAKTDAVPDLVMCSLDNLQVHSRVWIDEWMSPALIADHIEILKKCHNIVTSSLANAQEIWKHIPNANITRVSKPWPAMAVEPAEGEFFLYFEKATELTDLLLKSWDPEWGKLVVVGSSVKLPTFASYFSDSESYVQVMKLILGAKALVDLSENIYYDSGIINIAHRLGLPILSNNHFKLGGNFTLISQDKKSSIYPTNVDIRKAMESFKTSKHVKAGTAGIQTHNNLVVEEVRKILGT